MTKFLALFEKKKRLVDGIQQNIDIFQLNFLSSAHL